MISIYFSNAPTKTVKELSGVETNNSDIIKCVSNKYLFGIISIFSVLFENKREIYLKFNAFKKKMFCISIKF